MAIGGWSTLNLRKHASQRWKIEKGTVVQIKCMPVVQSLLTRYNGKHLESPLNELVTNYQPVQEASTSSSSGVNLHLLDLAIPYLA